MIFHEILLSSMIFESSMIFFRLLWISMVLYGRLWSSRSSNWSVFNTSVPFYWIVGYLVQPPPSHLPRKTRLIKVVNQLAYSVGLVSCSSLQLYIYICIYTVHCLSNSKYSSLLMLSEHGNTTGVGDHNWENKSVVLGLGNLQNPMLVSKSWRNTPLLSLSCDQNRGSNLHIKKISTTVVEKSPAMCSRKILWRHGINGQPTTNCAMNQQQFGLWKWIPIWDDRKFDSGWILTCFVLTTIDSKHAQLCKTK